jgi:hypothetical protein
VDDYIPSLSSASQALGDVESVAQLDKVEQPEPELVNPDALYISEPLLLAFSVMFPH